MRTQTIGPRFLFVSSRFDYWSDLLRRSKSDLWFSITTRILKRESAIPMMNMLVNSEFFSLECEWKSTTVHQDKSHLLSLLLFPVQWLWHRESIVLPSSFAYLLCCSLLHSPENNKAPSLRLLPLSWNHCAALFYSPKSTKDTSIPFAPGINDFPRAFCTDQAKQELRERHTKKLLATASKERAVFNVGTVSLSFFLPPLLTYFIALFSAFQKTRKHRHYDCFHCLGTTVQPCRTLPNLQKISVLYQRFSSRILYRRSQTRAERAIDERNNWWIKSPLIGNSKQRASSVSMMGCSISYVEKFRFAS